MQRLKFWFMSLILLFFRSRFCSRSIALALARSRCVVDSLLGLFPCPCQCRSLFCSCFWSCARARSRYFRFCPAFALKVQRLFPIPSVGNARHTLSMRPGNEAGSNKFRAAGVAAANFEQRRRGAQKLLIVGS